MLAVLKSLVYIKLFPKTYQLATVGLHPLQTDRHTTTCTKKSNQAYSLTEKV